LSRPTWLPSIGHERCDTGSGLITVTRGRVRGGLRGSAGDQMRMTDAQCERLAPLLPTPRGKLTDLSARRWMRCFWTAPSQHHHQAARRWRGRAQQRGRPPFKPGAGKAIGRSRGGLSSKLHALVADERAALIIGISPGQRGDAPARRDLLRWFGPVSGAQALIMYRAYHGDQTRQTARDLGDRPVVRRPAIATRSGPPTAASIVAATRSSASSVCSSASVESPPATTGSMSSSSASSTSASSGAFQLLCAGPSSALRGAHSSGGRSCGWRADARLVAGRSCGDG